MNTGWYNGADESKTEDSGTTVVTIMCVWDVILMCDKSIADHFGIDLSDGSPYWDSLNRVTDKHNSFTEGLKGKFSWMTDSIVSKLIAPPVSHKSVREVLSERLPEDQFGVSSNIITTQY